MLFSTQGPVFLAVSAPRDAEKATDAAAGNFSPDLPGEKAAPQPTQCAAWPGDKQTRAQRNQ
jgi:hypothetical protein